MITIKERVKNLLIDEPKARERKNRYYAVWYILKNIYYEPGDTMTLTKSQFLEVGPMILTITREINQLQQFDVNLRGQDYEDGKILAQEKQLELGYTPHYQQDLKKLKTLE